MSTKLTTATAISLVLAVMLHGSSALADSLWDHNGSVMRLVADGERRELLYEKPRQALQGAGVGQGTVLFDGYRVGNKYVGKAKRFSRNCPAPLTFPESPRDSGTALKKLALPNLSILGDFPETEVVGSITEPKSALAHTVYESASICYHAL